MSDRLPHPDEIVSAYLDGELTPVEAAAVEADETLAARAQDCGQFATRSRRRCRRLRRSCAIR